MVGSNTSAAGTTMVAESTGDHHQLPLADDHVQVTQKVQKLEGGTVVATKPAEEEAGSFAVEEPPVYEVAAAERQADVARLLAGFSHHLHDRTDHHLGYPYNLDFDFSLLGQFQSFCINNLGDPFIESNYGCHRI